MKEKPIIFSAPMVRAILDGIKTQTRRPVKNIGFVTGIGHVLNGSDNRSEWPDFCPYGKTGDRLWVCETWGYRTKGSDIIMGTHWENPLYRANADACGLLGHDGFGPIYEEDILWRSSIHMPRSASRISLEITGVRVERLQDISAQDAKSEGVECWRNAETLRGLSACSQHCYEFEDLWTYIHGKWSWDINPFVWVIEFKRIEK